MLAVCSACGLTRPMTAADLDGADAVLRLPETLEAIEGEAFAGTAFLAAEIPASVTQIAEDAFAGSQIRVLIGRSEYVRDYAVGHGFCYLAAEDGR